MQLHHSLGSLAPYYDLVIVGAGPAGMRAAITSASLGIRVLVIDQAPRPGGQIYRGIGEASEARRNLLGPEYASGKDLLEEFLGSAIDYLPDSTVWYLDVALTVGVKAHGGTANIKAGRVLVAIGAMERAMPIEGWELPGVMFAGAAQILLKANGLVPSGRTILAGSGPLLWLLADQLVKAGFPPAMLLDTTSRTNYWHAAVDAPRFLLSTYVAKGLKLLANVYRHVKVVNHVGRISVRDRKDASLEIAYESRGQRRTAECNTMLLHQGVVPNPNLARSAGCAFVWNDEQMAFVPQVDPEGRSSVPGIWIAGDAAGIVGAVAAEKNGALVGHAIAADMGIIATSSVNAARRVLLRSRDKALRGRRFLDILHRPATIFRQGTANSVICRCEEITHAELVSTLDRVPITGPNQLKAFLRCGMGPCQGRVCGLAVTDIIHDNLKLDRDTIGYYNIRPPVVPIRLGEMAGKSMT